MTTNTNPCSFFYRFVNGQQAIKDISGSYPKPNNKRKRSRGKDDDENCPHNLGEFNTHTFPSMLLPRKNDPNNLLQVGRKQMLRLSKRNSKKLFVSHIPLGMLLNQFLTLLFG
jgi:hypothetical protein